MILLKIGQSEHPMMIQASLHVGMINHNHFSISSSQWAHSMANPSVSHNTFKTVKCFSADSHPVAFSCQDLAAREKISLSYQNVRVGDTLNYL